MVEVNLQSRILTLVLGLAQNLAESFNKVGEVAAEELGGEKNVLTRQTRAERATEQLGLSLETKRRASLGVLSRIDTRSAPIRGPLRDPPRNYRSVP